MFRSCLVQFLTVMVLLSSASAFAGGGDGSGFNGPDLSPISIPGTLDRGVEIEDLNQAVDKCIAKGDSETGLVSLLEDLATRIYGRMVPGHYLGSAYLDREKKEVEVRGMIWSKGFSSQTFLTITSYSKSTTNVFFNLYREELVKSGHRSDNDIELVASLPLPRIRYESLKKEAQWDEWGRPLRTKEFLFGVSLEVPSDYRRSVKFKNVQTEREVAVTFSIADAVDCLQNEIQKSVTK